MTDIDTRRTILLTGAAGHIGTALRIDTADRYQFRLADLQVASLHDVLAPSSDIIELDVADPQACYQACAGVHTVVHLAADATSTADFYGSLLDANIKGTYNIFRAAKDQGCRRVVYASSAQAVEGYPLDQQITPTMPVRPKNMYGVTKCFGEAVAAYFAYQEHLSTIVVRIANYATITAASQPTARDLSAYISRADLVHLLTKCIDVPDVLFATVHGVSNNRFKRLDISTTRDVLGYTPTDDAFGIVGIPFHDT